VGRASPGSTTSSLSRNETFVFPNQFSDRERPGGRADERDQDVVNVLHVLAGASSHTVRRGDTGGRDPGPGADDTTTMAAGGRPWVWADPVRRAFDIDVLACPRGGGRLRLIATAEDPDAVRATLGALAGSAGLVGRARPVWRHAPRERRRRAGPERPRSDLGSRESVRSRPAASIPRAPAVAD